MSSWDIAGLLLCRRSLHIWVGSQDFFYISIQTFSMVLLTSKLEKRRVAPATAAPSSRKYEKRRSMSKGKNSFDFFLDNKNES